MPLHKYLGKGRSTNLVKKAAGTGAAFGLLYSLLWFLRQEGPIGKMKEAFMSTFFSFTVIFVSDWIADKLAASPDFDASTAGKSVFIKFLAPW